jgi:hypothetical protein
MGRRGTSVPPRNRTNSGKFKPLEEAMVVEAVVFEPVSGGGFPAVREICREERKA